ncbi:MAG: hypothetical protein AUH36_04485 [Chloroflexi bacterium 13_1_40CM_55_7]|nr:MAG: hypothetical protein AUI17_01330 [Acidobacteriales bacterium 13_2_20CM_2_55_5]OLC20943.1 MAG: hypothetical protein AUH36_04485 [Chloroflexi bacterium 13_1_40CM_55_7]
MDQLAAAGAGNRNPANFGIVTDDRAIGARKANIKFESVAAMSQGEIERSKSIFGNRPGRTCAAMAQE